MLNIFENGIIKNQNPDSSICLQKAPSLYFFSYDYQESAVALYSSKTWRINTTKTKGEHEKVSKFENTTGTPIETSVNRLTIALVLSKDILLLPFSSASRGKQRTSSRPPHQWQIWEIKIWKLLCRHRIVLGPKDQKSAHAHLRWYLSFTATGPTALGGHSS